VKLLVLVFCWVSCFLGDLVFFFNLDFDTTNSTSTPSMQHQLAFHLRTHSTSYLTSSSTSTGRGGEKNVPRKLILSLILIFPELVDVLEILPVYGSYQDLLWMSFELESKKSSSENETEGSETLPYADLIKKIDGFILAQIEKDQAAMEKEKNCKDDDRKKSDVSPLVKHLPAEKQNTGAKKGRRNNDEWADKYGGGKKRKRKDKMFSEEDEKKKRPGNIAKQGMKKSFILRLSARKFSMSLKKGANKEKYEQALLTKYRKDVLRPLRDHVTQRGHYPTRLLAEKSDFEGVSVAAFPKLAMAKNKKALVRVYNIQDQVTRNAPPPDDFTSTEFVTNLMRLQRVNSDGNVNADVDMVYFRHSLNNSVKMISKALVDGGGSDSTKILFGDKVDRKTLVAFTAAAADNVAVAALVLTMGLGAEAFIVGKMVVRIDALEGEGAAEKYKALKDLIVGDRNEELSGLSDTGDSEFESDDDGDGDGEVAFERDMLATVSAHVSSSKVGDNPVDTVDLIIVTETKLSLPKEEQASFLADNENIKTVTVHKMTSTLKTSYSNFPLVAHPLGGKKESNKVEVCILLDGTASMGTWMNKTKRLLKNVVNRLVQETSKKIFVSLVCYRDHDTVDPVPYDFVHLKDDEACKKFVRSFEREEPRGGADCPEDVAGGIKAALKLDWSFDDLSVPKFMFKIADAPAHGHYEHGDNFKHEKVDSDRMFLELGKKNINLLSSQITSSTEMEDSWLQNNVVGGVGYGNFSFGRGGDSDQTFVETIVGIVSKALTAVVEKDQKGFRIGNGTSCDAFVYSALVGRREQINEELADEVVDEVEGAVEDKEEPAVKGESSGDADEKKEKKTISPFEALMHELKAEYLDDVEASARAALGINTVMSMAEMAIESVMANEVTEEDRDGYRTAMGQIKEVKGREWANVVRKKL